MTFAVVILNWNGKSWLEKFLPSVIKYSDTSFCQIIVADNNSSDNSVEFLTQNFPTVSIIKNSSNGGYAKGYNEALKEVNADIFVLLNSDVEVSENWLTPFKEVFCDETIAAAMPKHHSKFEYAGAAGGFIDKYGYAFCRGRMFDSIEIDEGQYNKNSEIFWASGACLFVRSNIYKQTNGFDEDFFAHQEEIDLCWRIKNLGYKIMYVHNSEVYHVGGGTLNALNPKKTYLNFRNNLFMLHKNLPQQYLFKIIFLRLFLDGIAGVKFLLQGQLNHTFAVVKAHFKYHQNIVNLNMKRRGQNYIDFTSCVYLNSVVKEYFVLKTKKFTNLNSGFFSK
jgi:GT2 family glycosyltransferase